MSKKGKEIGGASWWPKKGAEAGIEFCGTFINVVDTEEIDDKTGEHKKAAMFDVNGEALQIGSGLMVKSIAPRLVPGTKYFVQYTGKKNLGGGHSANQFKVHEAID